MIFFYIKKIKKFALFLYNVIKKLINNIKYNTKNLFQLSKI